MKIAIPVKTNKENPAISPLFGKAKWFAFIENGEISIEKNEGQGGIGVVDWLIRSNIDTLIIQHMGTTPYNLITKETNMSIYFSGDERITLSDAITKFETNDFVLVDDSNANEIIKNH